MILSHEYKFVCLNPPKTGSGFREKLFKEYSDESVILNKDRKIRHWGSRQVSNYIKSLKKDPNDYYWFTFVRNPWERIISWINMNKNHALKEESKDESTIESSIAVYLNESQLFKNYIYRDGKLLDFVGSIENITEDLNFVLNKLNIDIPIGTKKDKYIKDFKNDIRNHFSQKIIEMIGNAEKEVIEMKKYKFK